MKSLSIALFLGKELHGKNIEVDNYSTLSDIQANTVVFAKEIRATIRSFFEFGW